MLSNLHLGDQKGHFGKKLGHKIYVYIISVAGTNGVSEHEF